MPIRELLVSADPPVRIEARYTVDEYDILILSAKQSGALEAWLRGHDYRIPDGAAPVLASYIKQGMKFFVARVNLAEQRRLGYSYLRPIQLAFESPRFMLPIRLGMVNAEGPQEMFVYALTRRGRVDTVNNRTLAMPTARELPAFVKREFARIYPAIFHRQVEEQGGGAVFTEYAWPIGSCDPCASDPIAAGELEQLGAGGLATDADGRGPRPVFLTRLHLRYDAARFPEDLVFQETADHSAFQVTCVLRHPARGGAECEKAAAYRREVRERRAAEARNLVALTGWSLEEVRSRMGVDASWATPGERTAERN